MCTPLSSAQEVILPYTTNVAVADLNVVNGRPAPSSHTMGFGELSDHIASLEGRGFEVVGLRVQLHREIAFPMVGLIMALLGVAFSFVVARRGALYGIGASIVIGIMYWACLGIFEG